MESNACPGSQQYSIIRENTEDDDTCNGDSHDRDLGDTWTRGPCNTIFEPPNMSYKHCIVSGLDFRPISSAFSGSASSYKYAVLRIGSSCPPGSKVAGRYLDTEDDGPPNTYSGEKGMNTVAASDIQLNFCVFDAPGMTAFSAYTSSTGQPVRYYVLHGFAATDQQPWVKAKRQWYVDDEDTDNQDGYSDTIHGASPAANGPKLLLAPMVGGIVDTTISFAKVQ